MATIKKKWNDFVTLLNISAQSINNNTKVIEALKGKEGLNADQTKKNKEQVTKLEKDNNLFKKILEGYTEKNTEYSSLREDLEIDNALTEGDKENGALLREKETGALKFSKEGTKNLNKDLRALVQKESQFPILELDLTLKPEKDYEFLHGFVIFKRGGTK